MADAFFHTATCNTPWRATGVTPAMILTRVKGMMPWLTTGISSAGAATSPYSGSVASNESAAYAFLAFLCAAADGTTTWVSTGSLAMTYALNNYGSNPDFTALGANLAWGLANQHNLVSAATLATWKTQLTRFTYTTAQQAGNWETYAMSGAWAGLKSGVITATQSVPVNGGAGQTVTAFIDGQWNANQAKNLNGTSGIYIDPKGLSTVPYSLSVDYAGRSNLTYILLNSYTGATESAMFSALQPGVLTTMQINDPTGQVPVGGRTSDHVWVDAGCQATMQMWANYYADSSRGNDIALAKQIQRLCNVNFLQQGLYARTGTDPKGNSINGTFGITKNQYAPTSRIGYQTASDQYHYNISNATNLGIAYVFMSANPSIGEAPFPGEIGGYVKSLVTGFSKSFANAGGIGIQICTSISGVFGSGNYSQGWDVLGVCRIGRAMQWDCRLGPSDGYIANDTAIGGSAFGPAWTTGSWTQIGAKTALAATGGTGDYTPTITTVLQSPCLTKLTINWTGNSGNPTHTQKLTICPDGILSQITSTVAAGSFGHVIPLLSTDGTTSTTFSATGKVASTSFGGASSQNFLLLDAGAAFTSLGTTITAYGQLNSYRAVGTSSESAVFVYPASTASSDPSATSVQGSFLYSAGSQNFSSSLGYVNGSLYWGRYTAGGFGSSIAATVGGTPVVTFSAACNFILTLSAGAVTSIETDAAVTATVNGAEHTVAAYTPTAVSGGGQVAATITLNEPVPFVIGSNSLVGSIGTGLQPTDIWVAQGPTGNFLVTDPAVVLAKITGSSFAATLAVVGSGGVTVWYSTNANGPITYDISNAQIVTPPSIPTQTVNQTFFVQVAFNYVPVRSGLWYSFASGSVILVQLSTAAGVTWDPSGQVVTIPISNTTAGTTHFFQMVDENPNYSQNIVSGIVQYPTTATAGQGGSTYTVAQPTTSAGVVASQGTWTQANGVPWAPSLPNQSTLVVDWTDSTVDTYARAGNVTVTSQTLAPTGS